MNASQLSDRLADLAEAVCRHYLPNGRREGRSWRVGDVRNTPGRSVTVRLIPDPSGKRAGKWRDLATGEHGDLLDIIREARGLTQFNDVIDEARRFLAGPQPQFEDRRSSETVPCGSPEAARRLFRAAMPIRGTLAEAYLRGRGINRFHDMATLRFHPRCYYGGPDATRHETWPALIAAVMDLDGRITGVHRTYLDPDGFDDMRLGKAPVECPKRSLGGIHGRGVSFGKIGDVLAAGEGIETVRSLKDVLPSMSMVSALSSSHLSALKLPPSLRHLYIVQDNDPAGIAAARQLASSARTQGITAHLLTPVGGDFNDDLRTLGRGSLIDRMADQLLPEHAERFLDRR